MQIKGRIWLGTVPGFLVAVVTFAVTLSAAGDRLAAQKDPPATPQGIAYFETHIRPVLAARCYSCHSVRTKKRQGGLLLDSRAGWQQGGDSGPSLEPGKADASLLIQALRYTDPDLQMPPDKPLPPDVIARFEHWVRIGAPDPRDRSSDNGPAEVDPSDPVAGRQHWAFGPLAARPVRPSLAAPAWPRSQIDALILAPLEAAKLQPSPDANRRDLVRRTYLQLIGLPPSPEQVSEFLEDERPDAFEQMVDRLLSSPHFGERWGRHWLDLARYADSNGLDENFLFREAWRYRNWVIKAINADVPFDRFVLEQIAGDLLAYDSIEQRDRQRIAAGFLVIGPKVLLGNDAKNQRMEVADEQLDTIGRAILGQTLGCARCHDHKFDPIPTADYYSLAGILTSTQVMERRYMLGSQRVMERLVGLGASGDDLDNAYEKFWRERPKKMERIKRAKSALELLKKKDDQEAVKAFEAIVKDHANAVDESARDTSQKPEARIAAQEALLKRLTVEVAKPPAIPPRAMIPADGDAPADESIRLAGQFDRLGDQVPRGFLRVLSDSKVQISAGQSGRMQLGEWLTATDGAGELAARVIANRVWHHLLGRGIVRTVDNFGRTGEAPSHPALLDHLARELIDAQWSIKALVRQIVLSRVFGLSSNHNAAAHAVDPENRLLWRAHRRRLDPESLRDVMLSAADQLDLKPMQSSVWYLGDQATAVGDNKNRRRTDFPARSVYLPVIRNDLPELFDVFDFADPHATTGMRSETMVATQGLFILNDESVMSAAEATARRLLDGKITGDDDARIDKMFQVVLSAPATSADRQAFSNFITATKQRLQDAGDSEPELRAWAIACHALFASSRFQILD